MQRIDVRTDVRFSGFEKVKAATSRWPNPPDRRVGVARHPRALVHLVDADAEVQHVLTAWLTANLIESIVYDHLGAFLNTQRADRPGCLVIDAQPSAIRGLEPLAILLPLAVRCPIVVTAYQTSVTTQIKAATAGAIEFVDKPLREREILTAVSAAIEVDCQRRRIASREAELRMRFATLSRRERQVMALVTTGMMNKQVSGDLGLSVITIKTHRGAAMRKMGARSLADLVRFADAIGDDVVSVRSERSRPIRSAAVVDHRTGYSLALPKQAMSSLAAGP